MNRIFGITRGISIPDGTTVYPFLNSKDETSGLPWDLTDGFSLSAGVVAPKSESRIHVMPLVTQVAFVLDGAIEVWMKDPENPEPYKQSLTSWQAILTRPGGFLHFVNTSMSLCWLLYIASPAYMFELDDEKKFAYDDSIILDEDWEQLRALNWRPPSLPEVGVMQRAREASAARLAAGSRSTS